MWLSGPRPAWHIYIHCAASRGLGYGVWGGVLQLPVCWSHPEDFKSALCQGTPPAPFSYLLGLGSQEKVLYVQD